MSDELEQIRNLMKGAAPEPDENAKKRAINSALSAFDEKNASRTQGTGWLDRLIGTATTYLRRFDMKRSYAIAGSLCVAVFAVGLMTTTHLSTPPAKQHALQPEPARMPAAQPVEITPSVGIAAPAPVASNDATHDVAPYSSRAAVMGSPSTQFMEKAYAPQGMLIPPGDTKPGHYMAAGRDSFTNISTNPVKLVKEEPASTFSIDVDTASYSFVRGALNNNVLPQKNAVRVEEMINYFPYAYEAPTRKDEPFKAHVTVSDTPWNKGTKLMHIGIKGYEIQAEKPRANLVFLLDTSGSMHAPDRLPLLQNSLKLMLDAMDANDTIAIVTYAGSAGTALEPTKVKDKAKIIAAIDSLRAGGSTAGAEGIRQAYQLAELNFDKKAVNRVLLATDGDFNVGINDPKELQSFVERKRESGIFLSVLGFGRGNYNDAMMQALAQNGNGNAAYIDNLNEARKVLVEEATSTLFPIAKDVKIQVEFNPATVAEYRLIGYETRLLNREDFNNDKVDAGDIGSGHTVTAIYEITPVGSKAALIDELRYSPSKPSADAAKSSEYAFVKIRYKQPEGTVSKLITTTVDAGNEKPLSGEAGFASAVAAFGELLRGSGTVKDFTYDDVLKLAEANKGADPFGYRAEFINLVRIAKNTQAMKPLGQ